MKKTCLFLCLAALFWFSSCMDTKYVTKKSTFDQVITQVSDEMSQQGFDLSGSSSETKNDLVVLRTSHTEEGGYGTELANNFVTRDTYRFTNATGHSISYTVSYMLRETKKGEQYVDAAEIAAAIPNAWFATFQSTGKIEGIGGTITMVEQNDIAPCPQIVQDLFVKHIRQDGSIGLDVAMRIFKIRP